MNRNILLAGMISALVLASCTGETVPTDSAKDDKAAVPAVEQAKVAPVAESSIPAEARPGEAEARPSDAPADLPNLDGAYDYNFYDGGTVASFGFKVQGDNLVALCDKLEGMLKIAGWERSTSGMNSEDEGNIYRQFETGTHKLTESCSLTDNVPSFALIKTVKK